MSIINQSRQDGADTLAYTTLNVATGEGGI